MQQRLVAAQAYTLIQILLNRPSIFLFRLAQLQGPNPIRLPWLEWTSSSTGKYESWPNIQDESLYSLTLVAKSEQGSKR